MSESGFSPVGEDGSEDCIEYVRVVSRDRGLTIYVEKGFNDHIHESNKIAKPRYCVGLTMNENHESFSGGIKQNIHASDCGPLVIVPKKFSLYFYKLAQITDLYDESSFFHVFSIFSRKVKADHETDELCNWWDQVVQLYSLDEDFSATDVPLTSKGFSSKIDAAKVKRKQREKDDEKLLLEQKRAKKDFAARQRKIKLNEERAQAKAKLAMPSREIVATVSKTSTTVVRNRGFKVFDQSRDGAFHDTLKIHEAGHGFALLVDNPDSEGKAFTKDFVLSVMAEKQGVEPIRDENVAALHKKAKVKTVASIASFGIFLGLFITSFIVDSPHWALIATAIAFTALFFLYISTLEAFSKHRIALAASSRPLFTHNFTNSIIVPKAFGNKITAFMKGYEDYSGYSFILDVLKDKIELEQGADEVESWLSMVDEISEIDSSFPLDMIPPMSEGASMVRDAIRKKKAAEAVVATDDAKAEQALRQDRNKMLTGFMQEDSEALTAGALALIGVVEDDSSALSEGAMRFLDERMD